MPMSVHKTAGGDNYANPFVGEAEGTVAIDVNIASLTGFEIDSGGRIKPGVPLTKAGALVGAVTISTIAAGVSHQNAAATLGNGVIGAATGGYNQPSETITITLTAAGATAAFDVYGDKSGFIGSGAVGTAFHSPQINVTIADGSTDWAALNTITFVVTGGVSDKVYGVTIEAIKLVPSNSDTDRTGTFAVAVATDALVNRDMVENILGRALTAAEINGFLGSNLALTNT